MINTVLETVKKYNMLNIGDGVVLGVSGGADSVALFHVFLYLKQKYNLKLICVHVNHGIRKEEAIRDQEFVRELCNKLNIPIKVFKGDIPKIAKNLKQTEEEAGRNFRYEMFNKVLKEENFNKIAVAHNLNDQAETVIMRMFRGSGLKGLGGILPVRDNIIRPLINCSRNDIEIFCSNNNISYITDSTNKETDYLRNKIRIDLLPYIQKKFNSNIVATLAKTAEILQEEEKYIYSESLNAYKNCVIKNSYGLEIDLLKLKKYSKNIITRVVRICFENYNSKLYNISSKHVDMVENLINNTSGKKVNLPNSIIAEKIYDTIIIYNNSEELNFLYEIKMGCFEYIKELNYYLSCNNKKISKEHFINTCTYIFNYDKINNDIVLRNRKPGDKIYIKKLGGNKKIKNYFIDNKIPRYKRDLIPLLADGNNIILLMHKDGITNDIYKVSNMSYDKKIYIQLWEEKNEP